jgi:hypothetical protein
MDFKFDKRKTKKDKERRNKEFNGKYSQKHIRIQEKEQENHLKNITTEKQKKTDKKGKKNKHLEN